MMLPSPTETRITSGAFHSRLMEPAAERFSQVLEAAVFRPPTIPVVSNTTAQTASDPGTLKEALALQMTGAVRWQESVTEMANESVSTFVEVGAGSVLKGLIKRTTKATVYSIDDEADREFLKEETA